MKKSIMKFLLYSLMLTVVFVSLSIIASQAQDSAAADTAAVAPTTLPSVTSTIDGFQLPTVVSMGIGLFLYFLFRFRIMAAGNGIKFSLSEWFSRNYMNVIYIVIAFVAIYTMNIKLSFVAALGLGMAPNLLIDWVQRELKAIGVATPS